MSHLRLIPKRKEATKQPTWWGFLTGEAGRGRMSSPVYDLFFITEEAVFFGLAGAILRGLSR
jgi:hypothetical protein